MIGEKFSEIFEIFGDGGPPTHKKHMEMIAHASAINSVQKSSKSELSSRIFGRLNFFPKKIFTSMDCEPHEQKYEVIKSTGSYLCLPRLPLSKKIPKSFSHQLLLIHLSLFTAELHHRWRLVNAFRAQCRSQGTWPAKALSRTRLLKPGKQR